MPDISLVLDLVYPRVCIACGAPAGRGLVQMCWDCFAGLEIVSDPFCAICGDPADGRVEHEYLCSLCRDHRPWFDVARSAARYRGPLRRALHAFKYEGITCLDRDLSSLALASVKTHYSDRCFEAVLPVPLFSRRERERTYNQSALLASRLGRALNVPVLNHGLERIKTTETQTGLSAVQRRMNVRGAFRVRSESWLRGRRLLLVDDVMTTGATVNECARMLKNAGAAGVAVVTVARG